MTMNIELAKFCGMEYYNVEHSCECGDPWCPDSNLNPDFSGKDFHLLHTAMGENRRWVELYNWLIDSDLTKQKSLVGAGCDFHERLFPEQAKLIYEFIKGEKK